MLLLQKPQNCKQKLIQQMKAQNSKSRLRELQDQLKRQYLLLERQQREKTKIKKQIQHTIQDYYAVLVEKKGLGKVISQDKLGNSYNFVKDLVLTISKDVNLGLEVLTKCDEGTAEQLSALLLGMFYQNFSENDPYLKKSTRFAQLLGKKISEQMADQNFMKQGQNINFSKSQISATLSIILKQFFKLESIRQYFQMLANRVLNKIPPSIQIGNIHTRRGSFFALQMQKLQKMPTLPDLKLSQTISVKRSSSFLAINQSQIDTKIQEAVDEYKSDVLNKSQMMPVSLRVFCLSLFQQLKKLKKIENRTINKLMWELLQPEYFRPFDGSDPKKWNHFKNSYFSQTVQRITQMMSRKVDFQFLQKLVDKIMWLNKDKLNKHQEEGKKKIMINGGCVSYRHLYCLFRVMKDHDKNIKHFNQRAANRVQKIYEMNPNFQFFKSFNNPSTSFLVFTQLIYGEIIEKDYLGMYNAVYNDHMIKNMLKQILSDTNFHILPYIQRESCFKDILQRIIKEQQMEGEGNFSLGALQHSPQFIMKIKYLVYLMQKQHISEEIIFSQMIDQCLQRQKNNILLFQKNKIQLLQSLTTVNKAKKMVKTQKQAEKNVDSHLKIVKILDTMEINLCITSPSTRPEKDKYIKTGIHGIIIQNASNCSHQSNIEEGLKHHACFVKQAIGLFCDLKQVKHAMDTGKDTSKIYEALVSLLDHLKQKCRNQYHVNIQEYNYFQSSVYKVVMRQIHEILIQNKQKCMSQIQFQKMLRNLSFIKPNRIKISGRDNLAELEQVWEIACRYLKRLNIRKTPTDKTESLLQMIEVIRISLHRDGLDKQDVYDNQSIQIILAYCLIRSRPQKLLQNINFIQVFLSKDKLVAKEGGALKRLKNAVALIKQGRLQQSLIDEPDFEEKLLQTEMANKVEIMKQSQKMVSMIGYV